MTPSAAFWSAVAASFAALSSFLIFLIQRRNLLESVRPELILAEWTRTSENQVDVIGFQALSNVGRGAALHLNVHAYEARDNTPVAVMSNVRRPILAVNESANVEGRIIVWWKNVEARDGSKLLNITIQIFCLDSRGMRHETKYSLLARELSSPVVFADDEIAPGVVLATRTTTTRAVWVLKLRRKLARVPGFRRLQQ